MLDARRQKALAALLLYPIREDAAKHAGMCARTLVRYEHEEEFSIALEAARRNALSEAARKINAALGGAVAALRSICENESASEAARVSAARGLLEFAIRYAEVTDLEKRLAALESEGDENVTSPFTRPA